jgi:D-alanyl-lipoteichoic acid acyltransferase DltB (MBOAT superfamily)
MAAIDDAAPAATRRLALSQTTLRNAGLFVLSVLAVYWLQPAMPVRQLDFWLPTAALALAVIVWAATSQSAAGKWRPDRAFISDGLAIGALVVGVAALRYVDPLSTVITRSRPPDIALVLTGLAIIAGLALGAARFIGPRPAWANALVIALIASLIALKWEPLAQSISAGYRTVVGQSAAQASAFDVRWLGFSYIFFRLVSTLRDRVAGRLPAITLREFVTYVVFFPSLIAGPIDRPERFVKDLRAHFRFNLADAAEGSRRIAAGLFKKFVIADLLALIALNEVNAAQTHGAVWMWLLVYAYSFRIFFDFSGYTDIAIGVGLFFGVRLPENFRQPYLKPNLTQFWNSWHMTLAQWFRTYYFNPLTRTLRTREMDMVRIILIGQVTTMLLIGLWHGITWNFALWGLWHGFGLFAHNRWADVAKARLMIPTERRRLQQAVNAAGIIITFNFVALGWVWFALPSVTSSVEVFRRLVGLS